MLPNLIIKKYEVHRVTLVGNVGEVFLVSEREREAFVANFPLATNQFYRNKEGEDVNVNLQMNLDKTGLRNKVLKLHIFTDHMKTTQLIHEWNQFVHLIFKVLSIELGL